MSDIGLKIIDGAQLRSADFSFPDPATAVAGARVFELAESRASQLLDGLSLPEDLKTSALRRLDLDLGTFPTSILQEEHATVVFRDYITAIADELRGENSCDLVWQIAGLF